MNLNRTKNNKSQPNHINSGSLSKLRYKYLQIHEVSFQTHQFKICLSSPWSSRFQPSHQQTRNSMNPRHETVLAISRRGWFANPPNFQKRNCRLENARRLRRLLQENVNPETVGIILFMLEGGFSLKWFESPMLMWVRWRFGNIFRCKWSDCYSTTIYPKIFLRFSSTIPTEAKPRSPSIAFNDRSKVEDLRMTRNNQMDIKNKIHEKKWPLR